MTISVIITTYNYARYVGRAIRSIYNQSLNKSEYEIIVVNDASTDDTMEVLKTFEGMVKIINLKENVGLAEARNMGVKQALGQFVVFLDADDYVHSEMLKLQLLFLTENSKLHAVAVDYYLVNELEEHREAISAADKPIACGIMFRKDLLYDIGLYDKTFRAREEEDLRIRFLKKYSIYNIILPFYRYRMHDSNLTKNEKEMSKYKQKLDKKHG